MSKTVPPITGTWRLYLVLTVLLLGVIALVWKVLSLNVVERDFLQGQGDARTLRTEPIMAHRGMITDRNGEPLAISSPVKSIWLNPREIAGNPVHIEQLADALDLNVEDLSESIANNAGREFMYVQRRMPPLEADRVLALGIDGVYSRQEYQRYYPQGEITAQLIGFSNIDDEGQEGLELAYDDWLRGVPGRQQVMKDRRGRIIRELNTLEQAQPGRALELSIDFRIQNLAYRELKAEFVQRQARAASAVVLDVETGEVLAMVNQPSFNPHNRQSLGDFGSLRNRAVTDLFEPGSTIKPFTAVAALETGQFNRHSLLDTSPGRIRVGRDSVNDRGNDYGEISLEQVIVKSSNVGTALTALQIGHEPLRDVLQRVGFGEGIATGFPGEQTGMLPSHRVWHDIETATLSFGYGLSTTTLQLAQAYAVLASGGIFRQVSLLKGGGGGLPGGQSERRVLDEGITREVQAMLEAVVDVDRGGFDGASVPFYRVAGKTGTARVVGARGYEANLTNSMFAGYAPADDPRIVVVVIINEPQGTQRYGSQVAAPIFSRIAAGAMRLLEVPPQNDDSLNQLRLTAR